MHSFDAMIYKIFRNGAVIVFLFLLQGCGIVGTVNGWIRMQAAMPDKTSVLVVPAPELAREEEFQYYVRKFTLMAVFSKVVYRQDIPESIRDKEGCEYLEGRQEQFGMPTDEAGRGWSRLIIMQGVRDSAAEIVSCFNRHGLYFETYIHNLESGNPPDMVVIAFRGTENYNLYQRLRDWSSNLAAMFGFDPTEYRHARERAVPLISEIRKRYPAIIIYLTGHSLGGGIAQQIAYVSPDVSATYVFDSSPVTNWSNLTSSDPPLIPPNYDPKIFRVSHTNEFLQGPRTIATRLSTTRINRADYEFFFQKTSRIDDHEIGILACNFAARSRSVGADFDLPASYIPQILNNPAICPPAALKNFPEIKEIFERRDE